MNASPSPNAPRPLSLDISGAGAAVPRVRGPHELDLLREGGGVLPGLGCDATALPSNRFKQQRDTGYLPMDPEPEKITIEGFQGFDLQEELGVTTC